jgi:hypothetical protein
VRSDEAGTAGDQVAHLPFPERVLTPVGEAEG